MHSQLPRSTDVFVAGGGPAGLAAAIAARREGFEVMVADPAIPPIDKACGEGVMPDGVAAARELGIELEGLEAFRFPGIRFHHRGDSVDARFPHGEGLGIRRTVLHNFLTSLAADAGVRMAWGARVQGLTADGVLVNGNQVAARWILGADGGNSQVRKWAGLDGCVHQRRRFGFRRHYRGGDNFAESFSGGFMEIHWGETCQVYITPVAANEVCVVVISSDPHLRLDAALEQVPEVARRLPEACGGERGAVSMTRRLRAVSSGRVALIGDASGSVDAITGDGLCLLFQQAGALAVAMAADDLQLYQCEHRRIGRRPAFMAGLMLLLDGRRGLRSRVIGAMAAHPQHFRSLLAMHVGAATPLRLLADVFALGWSTLTS